MIFDKIQEIVNSMPKKITYSTLEERGLNTFEVFHWLMYHDKINISEACRFLGISRRAVYYKISKENPLNGNRCSHPPVHVFKKVDDYIKFLKWKDQKLQNELLSLSEAARYLNVTPQYIWILKKKGKIHTVGKKIVRASLDMFNLKKCAVDCTKKSSMRGKAI